MARIIRYPRPALAPTSSPNTAPMTQIATAILAPAKIDGRLDGNSASRKTFPRSAEGAQQVDHVAVGRAETLDRVDHDREEPNQGGDDHLRPEAIAKCDEEQGRERWDRDGLAGDDDRVERPFNVGER